MVIGSIRHCRTTAQDDGFSLAELLIVIGIMGFVLAGAYALSQVTQKAAEVSERQAAFAREIGTPLQLSEIYLQQNSGLEEWGDYRLVCFVDRDLDGLAERVTIEAHSNGTFMLTVWNTDLQHQNTTQQIDFEMSENNVNVANGTPLFIYLDADGNEPEYDARASDTRSVVMKIEIEIDGHMLSDDRSVFFRNRS